MAGKQIEAIKNWISSMGFKLIRSHVVRARKVKINYYSLGAFGIYEEIPVESDPEQKNKKMRFISWTPWGDDFEVNSVNDLSRAYQDSIDYNPEISLS